MNQYLANKSSSLAIGKLYDDYSALLYGYILEVVNDQQIAEKYLVTVFEELPKYLDEMVGPRNNIYNRLQLLTRKLMADFFETMPGRANITGNSYNNQLLRPNKFLESMAHDEQLVFCNIHYHGKSITTLAIELKKAEGEIKKLLRKALVALRKVA